MADSRSEYSVEYTNVTRQNERDVHESNHADTRIILVGEQCHNDKVLQQALKTLALKTEEIQEDNVHKYTSDKRYDNIYVMESFSGDLFKTVSKVHRQGTGRVIGPPVIIRCAKLNEPLPINPRPLYCMLMQHLILCFTGFKVKEDLSRLADLVHHMGGSIRKDFSSKVTHLIANCSGGEKYRLATSMDTPIMMEEWVNKLWSFRHDIEKNSLDSEMMQYKVKPFYSCILSFIGFSKDEVSHMEEIAVQNGGRVVEQGFPECTHLVVDGHTVKTIPFITHPKLRVVKAEWFWSSIQIDACASESMYRYETADGHAYRTPSSATPGSMGGSTKTRKRKRLRDNLHQLASEAEVDSPAIGHGQKRRSNELGRMSMSGGSFLDATCDVSRLDSPEPVEVPKTPITPPNSNKICKRQQTVHELYHTEKNYVGILQTILKIKEDIEKPDQQGGPLLSSQHIKTIFGTIPKICKIHETMRDKLCDLATTWNENASIGKIILEQADELMKAYPPFVNFFENTKATLTQCDQTIPRFHAFLKVCQSKPECGRQTLAELFINPVQRLPRIVLLLQDLLKRTSKGHSDISHIEEAIRQLNKVLTLINENKRKADGQKAMFDIVGEIENCPPNLLSSHRSFIAKVDVIELSDSLSGKGDHITLFLFNDSLEICKRRTKVLLSKSPNPTSKAPSQKAYKHLEMLPLQVIKRVVDIIETEDCKNVFALVWRFTTDMKERLYSFLIESEDVNKAEFLKTLCKHMANTVCRADYENLMATLNAQSLDISLSDIGQKSLRSRFGKRVSRAFSFKQTPRHLKRTVSSISQSPFARRDSNTMTPRGDLKGMRLASTTDLTDQDSPLTTIPSTPNLSDLKYNTVGRIGPKNLKM
ncbi:unnamed protein product [Owenia fusiformis]|uniref:Uncharacterized protein n=1 Tax=Owenia fusiformis TaxID=6347 RepID=A0A8J1UCJ9_OWEFU|nr:unnamed protein product [Owenia fusiformis]